MDLHKKYNQITKSVKMTAAERNAMRASLLWHTRSNQVVTKSPFYTLPYVRFGMAFVFVILVSGGGVSFASQNALPGDFAYPIKIKIEEIKSVTKTTPKEKMVYSKKRAETRLEEMKALVAADKIDSQKIAIAQKELENHVVEAKENAKIIADTKNEVETKEALVEVKNLEITIEQNANILSVLVDGSKQTEGDVKQALNDVIAKNKDLVTDTVREIALPKKDETDALNAAVLGIENSLDEIPAGTGSDRSETIPQAE